ncbi:MAG TPA: hypothetical protein PKX20_05215 [Methanothrix soehngenii]|nr:hypothetical protein [Methanothrix soehngenii]
MVLFCAAQAAYPPEADLSIYKEAQIDGNATAEVPPGEAFDYVITVTNHHPTHSAPEVVVTDKLPYEVAIGSINVSSGLGESAVSWSGDLVYVRFDLIPAGGSGQIIISVTAPEEAPTTLYNIANLRYGNDPNPANNRVTISTYVPLLGYDHLGVVEGLPGREALESNPTPPFSGCQSCQRG